MAQSGATVLIVERETTFRDRVRGEALMPWGSVEAKTLGVYDLLLAQCGQEAPRARFYFGGKPRPPRDFLSTTPMGTCVLTFFHPEMQEVLLSEAASAGAEVCRGASLADVKFANRVNATISRHAESEQVDARLIVGADGRESRLATMLEFERQRDPEELYTVGFQLSGNLELDPALYFFVDGIGGRGSIVVPNKTDNYRAYFFHHKDALPRRLSGKRDYATALHHLREIGVPAEWLDNSRPHGILASFDGAHRWVTRPARGLSVLLGDAAGTSDPVWGNGLSRTLRDVRLLRDHLLAGDDWEKAVQAYANDHNDFFQRLRRVERFYTMVYFSMGNDGEAGRARVMSLLENEPALNPDMPGLGPEARVSDQLVKAFEGD
jgi:2-polyprenyl-6-methoxyphenol hydroxylase-like FAD-dependent oxidoreductase